MGHEHRHRQPELVLEQEDRAVRDGEAVHLEAPGEEERRCDGDPREELEEPVRDARGDRVQLVEESRGAAAPAAGSFRHGFSPLLAADRRSRTKRSGPGGLPEPPRPPHPEPLRSARAPAPGTATRPSRRRPTRTFGPDTPESFFRAPRARLPGGRTECVCRAIRRPSRCAALYGGRFGYPSGAFRIEGSESNPTAASWRNPRSTVRSPGSAPPASRTGGPLGAGLTAGSR